MTKLQQRKAEKLVILVRYFLKQAYTATDGTVYKKGSVICLVRNPEGREYYVTLNRNNRHSCQCEGYATWNKRCYHIEHCREVENARLAEEREAQRNQIATRAASETDLARIEAETLAQIEQEQAAPVAPKSEQARIADLDESDEDVKLEEWTRQELSLADEANYPLDAAEKTIKRMEANMTPEEKAERDAARAARRERAMESAPLNGSRAFSLLRR